MIFKRLKSMSCENTEIAYSKDFIQPINSGGNQQNVETSSKAIWEKVMLW